MYRNIIRFIIILSFIFSFTSCDLDKSPNSAIPLENAWKSINDASHFRIGAYNTLRSTLGGLYYRLQDYQSDLFNETIESGNRYGEMYRWDFTSSTSSLNDYWYDNYSTINECNNIINNIDKLSLKDTTEENTFKRIKGESHFIRAIAYHALVLRFAKDYEPASATTDLGLPLVIEYNIKGKPDRSDLQATYDFIKKDISIAREYLTSETEEKDESGNPNKARLSTSALDLFEARVNLYLHDFDNAITLSNKVISRYPLVSQQSDYLTMWKEDKGTEIIFQPAQNLNERITSYSAYYFWNTSTKSFRPDFIPSKWVVDLYADADIRKNAFFHNAPVTAKDIIVNDVYLLSKFPGNPILQVGSYDRYNMTKVFRSAEAYLILAESQFRSGQEALALKTLNEFKSQRNAPIISTSLVGVELFSEIKSEWLREFIGEGQRLSDLKRWHDGFTRHSPQNQSIIAPNLGVDLSVPADDFKFVWEIPSNDLITNTNLKPNWNN